MEKRSIQNTRNKVFIVFIRQGEVVYATQVVGRLKVEKLVVERGLNLKQRQPTGHLQRHQPRLQLLKIPHSACSWDETVDACPVDSPGKAPPSRSSIHKFSQCGSSCNIMEGSCR